MLYTYAKIEYVRMRMYSLKIEYVGYICSSFGLDVKTKLALGTVGQGPCTNYITLKGWGGVGPCASDSCSLHSFYMRSTKLLLNFSLPNAVNVSVLTVSWNCWSAIFRLDVINLRKIVSYHIVINIGN